MKSGCSERCNEYPKPRFTVDLEQDVRIPMTDGVGLYADIYRPRGAGERLPTILIRTPYSKAPYRDGRDSNMKNGIAFMFAGQGFIVVVQDVRGRFRSEASRGCERSRRWLRHC